jgi:hypothetical protein
MDSLFGLLLGLATPASAGASLPSVVTENPDGSVTVSAGKAPAPAPSRSPPPERPVPTGSDTTVLDWVRYFAEVQHVNFVLAMDGSTPLALTPTPAPDAAWQQFVSALDAKSYVPVAAGAGVVRLEAKAPVK